MKAEHVSFTMQFTLWWYLTYKLRYSYQSIKAAYRWNQRTALQAGHMWGNMFTKLPAVPILSDWGYILQCQSVPKPLWITKPVLSRKNCKQLSTCRCQTGECRPPCTCCRYKITCTTLCGCNAMCSHSQNVLKEISENYKAICDKC